MGDEKPSLPSEPTSEEAAADAFRRRVEAIYGGPLPEPQEPPPPSFISLSSIKSEYRRLCDELGGPIEGLGPDVPRSTFERCCSEYSSDRILPVLLQFKDDKDYARRHWPHAAFALNQYVFEIKERNSYADDEPTPQQVADLLKQIARSASSLMADLCRLQTLAERLNDLTAPDRRGHLGWLDAFVSQAAAGLVSNEVNEEAGHLNIVVSDKLAFLERLAEVQAAAETAATRYVDNTLLTEKKVRQIRLF